MSTKSLIGLAVLGAIASGAPESSPMIGFLFGSELAPGSCGSSR